MSLDPPDEWWWHVANDNRGQPNLSIAIRPPSYRFRWTRVRARQRTQFRIEQILNAVYETTHHYACRRLNLRFAQPDFSQRG